MTIEQMLIAIVPILLGYIAYNERDKDNMRTKETVTKEEVEKLVDLKLVEHRVEIKEIKEDIREVKNKLDKVIEILIHR